MEIVLTGLRDKSELSGRLAILDRLRVPRYSCAQLISAVRHDEGDMEVRYVEVMEKCRRWFEGEDQSHCKSYSTSTIVSSSDGCSE